MPTSAYPGYSPVDTEKLVALVANMTLREKLEETGIPTTNERDIYALLFHPFKLHRLLALPFVDSWFHLLDNPRLGLRGFRTRDGPKGITCASGQILSFPAPCPAGGVSPSFPAQCLRAATWDTALEQEFGQVSGEIAHMLGVDVGLFPAVNILPWLNAGRGQEAYSEDPFFTGKMAAAVVRGVQSQGTMATLKHFLANNIERTRWHVSAEMDEQTLHEVYLRQWAVAVRESSPEWVMTSYNRVQGNWSNFDPKFLGLLRGRLGFQGSVMTDWGATMSFLARMDPLSPFAGPPALATLVDTFFGRPSALLAAGVDLEMPFNSRHWQAVRQLAACEGPREELCQVANDLDRSVGRLLRSKLRFGLARDPSAPPPPPPSTARYNDTATDELALRIAERGIVLLKNAASFLPRPPPQVRHVAVLGTPHTLELGDKGSSAQNPSGAVVTVFQGLQEAYGAGRVEHVEAGDARSPAVARADLVVLDVGTNHTFEGEYFLGTTGGDRPYLGLHPWDLQLIRDVAAVNSNVVVAMSSGQVMLVEEFVDLVPAVLWLGYPGPMGGRALARLLAGDAAPSGRMPSATPKRAEDWVPAGTTLEPWTLPQVQYPYAHGFKHMWGAGIAPRFPMGWGLSYTTFAFGHPALLPEEGRPEEAGAPPRLRARVAVTNLGARAGLETVQVYVTCGGCERRRLPIMLVGFAKVVLEPAETAHAEVAIEAREFAAYDEAEERWVLEAARYTVHVGPCADPAALRGVDYSVEQELWFDYPGPSGPASVPGLGERDCAAPSTWQCVPDAAFLRQERAAALLARGLQLAVLALCWCACWSFAKCCTRAVGRGSKERVAKAKDA